MQVQDVFRYVPDNPPLLDPINNTNILHLKPYWEPPEEVFTMFYNQIHFMINNI